MTLKWARHGAVSSAGVAVKARVDSGTSVELLLSAAPDLSSPTVIGPETPDADGVVGFSVLGLSALTQYYYGLRIDGGTIDPLTGAFRTFPTAGPASFTMVHGSCNATNANGLIWDYLRDLDPDLFWHLGDLHYRDIEENDPALFLDAYDTVLNPTRRVATALRQLAAVARMHDDHDYGPNNSDRHSPGREASIATFRQCEPAYPYAGSDGVYQEPFDYGRLRCIVTDLRSFRDKSAGPGSLPHDHPDKTQLGADQKAWFKAELLAAKAANKVVAWGNTVGWIGDFTGGDGWWAYKAERQEIADFVVDNDIDIFILSGDIHAIMIDDGSNSPGGIPVFHAAPFNQYASTGVLGGNAGGPYSHSGLLIGPASPGDQIQQCGVTTITDDGTTMGIKWEGVHIDPTTGDPSVLVEHEFSIGGTTPPSDPGPIDTDLFRTGQLRVHDGTSWVPIA